MSVRLPPGPAAGFLGMNAVRRFRTDPLEFISEVGHSGGDLSTFRLGPYRAYLVNQPDLIREVLVTKAKLFRKQPKVPDALREIDGEGLVVTEGDFWLRQRRLLQPAFHSRRMGRYADTVVERTSRFLDDWRPGETRNIVNDMTHLTVRIIAKLFYNLELADEAETLGQAVRTLSEVLYEQVSMLAAPPTWVPTRNNRRKKRAIRTLDGLIQGAIRRRRDTGGDEGDLLSMLLLAVDEEGDGKGMSDRQARDEAVTMFNAGHDSTAAALAWIWALVAQHPEVERQLIAEVKDVLDGRRATFADVPRLAYADRVVRETLRLYPAVWTLFTRTPTQDVELGSYTIPKGSWVYVFPWVTHRDPRFFPDPLRFDPDRFSPERAGEIPQYAWIPFGGGPHVCIGQGLAITEMVLILATTLQRFRLALSPDQGPIVPEPLLAIRPKGGLRMCVLGKT